MRKQKKSMKERKANGIKIGRWVLLEGGLAYNLVVFGIIFGVICLLSIPASIDAAQGFVPR